MNRRRNDIATIVAVIVLLAGTAGVFWRVGAFDFINFDDPQYVTGNDFVNSGMTLENVKRAFTGAHSSNWHPLTWISHMLDCELFGLNPGPHHLSNLLLHAANAVLLFLLLRKMTGSVWRSATVAMLFAVHPLHVESVAWISERKDVLSGFFFFLTVWFYVRYTRSRCGGTRAGVWDYTLSLWFFACGLMSKPMLVTMPFVLLLLDIWPLKRSVGKAGEPWWRSLWVRDKAPFLALTIVSCIITFIAQRNEGAVRSVNEFSIAHRIGNAAVAYGSYLRKTFWPNDLAVFYPHQDIGIGNVLVAVTVLAGISALAFKLAQRRPYVLVGWLWFLGMLVPVIGLVQVGEQSMADRYSYLPLIGVFIAVTWGVVEFMPRLVGDRTWIPKAIGVGAVTVYAVLGFLQVQHWRNTETLFSHAVAVTENNYLAMNHLSTGLIQQGRIAEAETLLTNAVRLRPQFHDAQLSLGNVLAMQGRLPEAQVHFLEAIKILPDSESAHFNLGNVLKAQGQFEGSFAAYAEVLRLNPSHAEARSNLALLLVRNGQMEEAALQYAEVVRLQPNNPDARYNFGTALINLEQFDEAEEQYRASLVIRSEFPQAHWQLARLMIRRGDREEARAHLRAALRLDPGFEDAQRELAALAE